MKHELAELGPPKDLEAEVAVIGSMVFGGSPCIDDVVQVVSAADFFAPEHSAVFDCLKRMNSRGHAIDVKLAVDELKKAQIGKRSTYDAVGGAAGFARIMDSVATSVHAKHYATNVRTAAVRRALDDVGIQAQQIAHDDDDDHVDAVSRIQARLSDVVEGLQVGGPVPIADAVQDAMSELDERLRLGTPAGLMTGFPSLDEVTGGFRPGQLVVVGARTSVGKTALALNITSHMARKSRNVFYVSLEMTRVELSNRLISAEARVNGMKLSSSELASDEKTRVVDASEVVSGWPITIDDSRNLGVDLIASRARMLRRRGQLDVMVVDYIQLVRPENSRDVREQQVAKVARSLKNLAGELRIPVICLAQLNRQYEEKGNTRPKLSHLRESGAVEQDADIVLLIHRPDDGNGKQVPKLIIAKNRNGPKHEFELEWDERFAAYRERGDQWSTN